MAMKYIRIFPAPQRKTPGLQRVAGDGRLYRDRMFCTDEVRRFEGKIHLDTKQLENREEIEFPERRIVGRLEFTDELSVAILEALCPVGLYRTYAAGGWRKGA